MSSSSSVPHSRRTIAVSSQEYPVIPDHLRDLFLNDQWKKSSVTLWFPLKTFQEYAAKVFSTLYRDCYFEDEKHVDDDDPKEFIPRCCRCWIPDVPKRTQRPEKKMAITYEIDRDLYNYLNSRRAYHSITSRYGTLWIKTYKANRRTHYALSIRKAVRIVYITWMCKYGIPLDKVDSDGQPWELSHLCHNGHEGCCKPNHLSYEPKAVNLSRKMCYRMIQCAVPDCGGYIIGNRCQGHDDVPDCLQPSLRDDMRCTHYTAHYELASGYEDSDVSYSDDDAEEGECGNE